MTKIEAIEAIKSHCYFPTLVPVGKEALDMAIKALDKENRIMQILDDCDLEAWEILEKIKEVVRA